MLEHISECLGNGCETETQQLFEKHFFSIFFQVTTGGILEDNSLSENEVSRLASLYADFSNGVLSLPFLPSRSRAKTAAALLFRKCKNMTVERLVCNEEQIIKIRDGEETKVDVLTAMFVASPLKTNMDGAHRVEVQAMTRFLLLLWLAAFVAQTSTLMNCLFEIGFNDSRKMSLMKD